MKQIVQIPGSGDVRILDVPLPQLRSGGALVETRCSLISAGTERAKIELGKASLIGKARARPDLTRQVIEKARQDGIAATVETVRERLGRGAALGYSASGIVTAVSPDCTSVSVGDLVACAGAGFANHAEVNFVPRNLLARVPEGMTAERAAYGTLGAIALHGVRRTEPTLGETVAVVGLGLIGLLVVQLARAAGARVLATDLEEHMCDIATALGAERALPTGGAIEAVMRELTEGSGVDAVIICASTRSSEPVHLASQLSRDRARVVVVGDVGMDVPREPFYARELELRLSRSYGPGRYDREYEEGGRDYPIGYVRWTEQRNLAEFLRLVATGAVDVDVLTTHRFPFDHATDAYELLAVPASDERRPIGVLLDYPDHAQSVPSHVPLAPRRVRQGQLRVGLIGAGNFASRVLLPALAADERVTFSAVCSASGLSARAVADRVGFTEAMSTPDEVIDASDAVVIATRHDSHARLAAAAVSAGKSVFCEKPLAIDWPGLEQVAAAYSAGPVPLAVGFNRRFSPLVARLRQALPPGVPRGLVYRVNAGALPDDHWTKDPQVGGGRLIGELCHFLDLAAALAEGRPLKVFADGLGCRSTVQESAVVQVLFADGSIASIQYLSNGDPSLAKERLEVYAGGVIGIINDFSSLELHVAGKQKRDRRRIQAKGHREELRDFVTAATGGELTLQTAADVFWSSALALRAVEALGTDTALSVGLPFTFDGEQPS